MVSSRPAGSSAKCFVSVQGSSGRGIRPLSPVHTHLASHTLLLQQEYFLNIPITEHMEHPLSSVLGWGFVYGKDTVWFTTHRELLMLFTALSSLPGKPFSLFQGTSPNMLLCLNSMNFFYLSSHSRNGHFYSFHILLCLYISSSFLSLDIKFPMQECFCIYFSIIQ